MSLYVNSENQELLWNLIHRHEVMQPFFSRMTPAQQGDWFKKVIQIFYNKYANANVTVDLLKEINRDTLIYMIEFARGGMNSPENASSVNMSNSIQYVNQSGRPITDNTVIRQTQTEMFSVRQKEYEQMTEKKSPPVLDFNEKIEDTAISNMDELIQEQLRMREEELKQYATIAKVNIDSSPANIQLDIDTLESNEASKKNVSWSGSEQVSQPSTNPTSIVEDIENLKQTVTELSKLVSYLQIEIASMQTKSEDN